MILSVILYSVAIICGALTKELLHFNKNQGYYSRGVKTIGGQIDRYLLKRWDNLAVAIPMGVIFTLVFHNVANSDAISALLLSKIGLDGVSLSVSGYALVAIFSAFSDFLARKLGIIKADKLED